MKTVVVAMRKGGSGKSTLTANLGVQAHKNGDGPVALVDSDPMAGTADWYNARMQAEDDVRFLLVDQGNLQRALEAARSAGVKHTFIDTPPAANEAIGTIMKLADLILVPLIPSPDDVRALPQTLELIEQADKPFMFVLNQANPRERLTKQTHRSLLEMLKSMPNGRLATTPIANRTIYKSSKIDGRTVVELTDKQAIEEIECLWMEVSTMLNGVRNGKARR